LTAALHRAPRPSATSPVLAPPIAVLALGLGVYAMVSGVVAIVS
jgi:hypothetical protein